MDTTNKTTPGFTNSNSGDEGQGNVTHTHSKEVGGELAKECGGSKNPQITLKETGRCADLGTIDCPYSYFTFEINGRDYSWIFPDKTVLGLLDNYASKMCIPNREPVLQTLQIHIPFGYELIHSQQSSHQMQDAKSVDDQLTEKK